MHSPRTSLPVVSYLVSYSAPSLGIDAADFIVRAVDASQAIELAEAGFRKSGPDSLETYFISGAELYVA